MSTFYNNRWQSDVYSVTSLSKRLWYEKDSSFFLYTIVLLLVVFTVYAFASGRTYLFKAVWYNFADIDDYEKFTNNTVTTDVHQPWDTSTAYNGVKMPDSLHKMLQELSTVAVLVIKNDSLYFEQYDEGYNDSSWSGSFSVAKSITGLLIGAAIKQGKIGSVQDLVGKYLPEFASGKRLR
ncbi:hypothetical protein [Paraflavitalea speifideaquila]|uniref:hypothetical protein n=1 Tax=Paraflavitalea speifideaquila TaxID=3076558 RepID=UPI0028E38E9E|nr:hypothetical protein [Paraflavitalea speifideiaquila]